LQDRKTQQTAKDGHFRHADDRPREKETKTNCLKIRAKHKKLLKIPINTKGGN